MNIIVKSALALLCTGLLACAQSEPRQSLPDSAKQLNAQAKASLGVSIESLFYLYEADPGSVLLKAGIASWDSVKALEKAGLVTIHESQADGDTFVQIVRTELGGQVYAQLRGP